MDNLTDSERRQIYEEEKRKEDERRRRRIRRPDNVWLAVVAFLVLFVVLIPIVGQAGLMDRALARNEAQVRAAGKFPTAPPQFLPTPAPTPATGIRTSFGDGVWLIGIDIPAGTYRAETPSSACYWARVAGGQRSLEVQRPLRRRDRRRGVVGGHDSAGRGRMDSRCGRGVRDDRLRNVAAARGVTPSAPGRHG